MDLKTFLLVKVRLTYYFLASLFIFSVIAIVAEEIEFSDSALMVFSVNSFLFGFYISPIISSQRDRVDNLHKLVRIEASNLYEIALYSKRLEKEWHQKIVTSVKGYTEAAYVNKDEQGEKEYGALMDTLISYDGKQDGSYIEMMRAAFMVQENRSEINRLLATKIYKNEWIIMLMLFSVTLVFILLIKLPDAGLLKAAPPVVSAGLTMLLVILAKMNALTHKHAKKVWDPLNNLSKTNFHKINSD